MYQSPNSKVDFNLEFDGFREVRRPPKLLSAARRWYEGGSGKDEAADDARFFGIDPGELVARAPRWSCPEAWDTTRTFVAAATQWRVPPAERLLGLDYAGTRAAALGWSGRGSSRACSPWSTKCWTFTEGRTVEIATAAVIARRPGRFEDVSRRRTAS